MVVIHMMGHGAGAANNADTVRTIRQAIKSENPDAYLLGEHFFEATPWLQGDQEDGAMPVTLKWSLLWCRWHRNGSIRRVREN